MLSTLIMKELLGILRSPKFSGTFAVCSVLILLSTFIGIREYTLAVRQYETATQLVNQELRQSSQWMGLNNRTFREPDPMQIFVSGVNYDIGRWSSISQFEPVKLRHSSYSDDPIFALFRIIDFSFVVQIVLSLFAVLFTYDAINGERESGTLALTFANAVPKAEYLMAKVVGSWLGLVLPLLIPMSLAVLLVLISGVALSGPQWMQLVSLYGVSFLYFTFFIVFGLLMSTLTRQSNMSFLLCLVAWVLVILVLPRAGVIIAGQTVSVPSVSEIDGQREAFAKDRWEQHRKEWEERLQERQAAMAAMSKEEREQYENDHLWGWMERDDASRKQVEKDIDAFGNMLQQDLRNRLASQEKLAFTLSRFSPASAYQLAVMNIVGTDLDLKRRYEDALREYRTIFNAYTDKKQKASGGMGGIRITMDSEKGFSFEAPREQGALNMSDMPRFTTPTREASFPIVDAGILGLATLLAFAGAFVAFLRYDVRP